MMAGFVTIGVPSRAAIGAEKDSVASRLQRLEDRESIRNLIMEYGRTLDERQWPAFANLFAENGGEWSAAWARRRAARRFRK
jgi:hypothetical protein